MGVYIKGMEMPQSCYECVFQHPCQHDSGIDYCVVIDAFLYSHGMKENDCPLIEVAEHGRLIDADALDKHIYNDIPIKVFGNVTRMARIRDIVCEAPTVIEASGVET